MAENMGENRPVRDTSHGNNTSSDNKKRVSGVVITGGRVKRSERVVNIPSEREQLIEVKKEKERLKRERKEAEWNRGIVRIRTGSDRVLLLLILLLLVLGTIMVFSASYPLAQYQTQYSSTGVNSMKYIERQLMFVGIGLVVMALVSRIPYAWFMRLAPFAYGVGLALLVLALFIGHGGDESTTEAGVRRWIGIKGTAFNIQPSELMKPALVMMLAWYMNKFRDNIIDRTDRKTYIISGVIAPFCIVGIACMFVILGKHLSGTLIVAAIGVCIIFLGGAHIGYTVLVSLVGGLSAIGAYVAMNPYALKRLTTFADSSSDVLSDKWQTTQGLYAIGSGGLLGTGLGGSNQKFSYVSDAHTDFIFTIWCEEMGFVGAVLLIGLFLAFIWQGLKVARHAPDTFGCLLAAGIVIQVGLQAFFNIGVVTDILPNTGVPLPFFSYGGSSLVVLMAEMGVLLSISRHSYQKRL